MSEKMRRVLIVIDVQNDYVHGNLPIEYPPVEHSLANIGRVMDAARENEIPVVVVQHLNPAGAPFMAQGTTGAALHPVVAERPWDHFIEKNLPDAFSNTDLKMWLLEHEINTVTVTGYMTHNCDLATVIHGISGFAMEFLSDATGSLPYTNRAGAATAEEIHRVITVVMQARFAAVMTTDEWLVILKSGEMPKRETIYVSNLRAKPASAT